MTELNSPKEMIFQLIHEYGGEKRKEMFDYITTLENYDDIRPLTDETLEELGRDCKSQCWLKTYKGQVK